MTHDSRRRVISAGLALVLWIGGCGDGGSATPSGMIQIAGGTTWIGCDSASEPACTEHETPRHAVDLPSYAIDEREVTIDAFVAFINDHGNSCGDAPCADDFFNGSVEISEGGVWSAREGQGSHPMTQVSWFGADAYCKAKKRRLCSEAEWEMAALGACADSACATTKPLYPWGNEAPTCELAHMFDSSDGCGTGDVAPVGSTPAGASPDGVLDMAGNAWEWVADTWHEDYQGAPTDGSAWVDETTPFRVVRGGGLTSGPPHLRGSHRHNAGADSTPAGHGFRCCR